MNHIGWKFFQGLVPNIINVKTHPPAPSSWSSPCTPDYVEIDLKVFKFTASKSSVHCLLHLWNSSQAQNYRLAQIWNECNQLTGEVIDIHERSGKCIKSAETIIRKNTILNKLIDWAWAPPQKLKTNSKVDSQMC